MRRIPVAQRRSQLIDAAIRVIERDGVAAATVRAIVAEAEMPLGAFHYAFTSREELLPAIIQHVTNAERMGAWMWVHVSSPKPGPQGVEQLLRVGLEGYLAVMASTPGQELALLEVAFQAIRNDPGAVNAQWQMYRAATLESLDKVAQLAGVEWTAPSEDLACWLNQSIDGLTLHWLATRDDSVARSYIGFIAAAFAKFAQVSSVSSSKDALTLTSAEPVLATHTKTK